FFGDHSFTDMEVVQQSHLHLGADRERAILETIARNAKCRPHVIEYAVGRCEPLDGMKGNALRRVKHAEIHSFDGLAPLIANPAGGSLPDGIFRIELDALVYAIGIFLMQVHIDQVERVLALFLVGLWQVAASKKLLDSLTGFFDKSHDPAPPDNICCKFWLLRCAASCSLLANLLDVLLSDNAYSLKSRITFGYLEGRFPRVGRSLAITCRRAQAPSRKVSCPSALAILRLVTS